MATLADGGDEASITVFIQRPRVLSAFLPVHFFSPAVVACHLSHLLMASATLYASHTSQWDAMGGHAVTRSVGNPSSVSDELLERCLARMAAWVRLAAATVRSEFHAFAACSRGPSTTRSTACLPLLSFNVDPQCLRSQLVDFWLTAFTHHDRGLENFSAW